MSHRLQICKRPLLPEESPPLCLSRCVGCSSSLVHQCLPFSGIFGAVQCQRVDLAQGDPDLSALASQLREEGRRPANGKAYAYVRILSEQPTEVLSDFAGALGVQPPGAWPAVYPFDPRAL